MPFMRFLIEQRAVFVCRFGGCLSTCRGRIGVNSQFSSAEIETKAIKYSSSMPMAADLWAESLLGGLTPSR